MAKERFVEIRGREIATLDSVLRTYNDPENNYHARNAADFLGEWMQFPLTYESREMTYLNTLGLYVYYSGSISVYQGKSTAGYISENGMVPPVEQWEENLGMNFMPLKRGVRNFGENGAKIIRLLHAMGFHSSSYQGTRHDRYTRKDAGSQLPPYLIFLIDNHDKMNRDSRQISKRYLRDVISVWFHTKEDRKVSESYRVYLLSRATEEEIDAEADTMLKVMSIVYPRVEMDLKRDFYKKQAKPDLWVGSINFPIGRLVQFPRGVSPVKIDVQARPVFSFERHFVGRPKPLQK